MHLGTFRGPSGGPGAFSLTHPPRGLWKLYIYSSPWGPPLGLQGHGDPRATGEASRGLWGTPVLPQEFQGPPGGPRDHLGLGLGRGPRGLGAPRSRGPKERRGPCALGGTAAGPPLDPGPGPAGALGPRRAPGQLGPRNPPAP